MRHHLGDVHLAPLALHGRLQAVDASDYLGYRFFLEEILHTNFPADVSESPRIIALVVGQCLGYDSDHGGAADGWGLDRRAELCREFRGRPGPVAYRISC